MQQHTEARQGDTLDEIWLVEHEPVYTLGRAANPVNLMDVGAIPVVQVDRGGDVTYHGPGQVVIYLLCDIKRLGLGIRELVSRLERSVIEELQDWGIAARARPDAPGVYVGDSKIASLGLRIRKGCSYHGIAFNLNMDMQPWAGINACALGVPVTQLADLVDNPPSLEDMAERLLARLTTLLGYRQRIDIEVEIEQQGDSPAGAFA
jgi:lipoyl(octanoyl) transferase